MEKETDIFSKFPKEYVGLIVVTFGLLMMIGAIRRWGWVLDMTGERSRNPLGFLTLMQEWFGEKGLRVGIIIVSAIIIICGAIMFVLMN